MAILKKKTNLQGFQAQKERQDEFLQKLDAEIISAENDIQRLNAEIDALAVQADQAAVMQGVKSLSETQTKLEALKRIRAAKVAQAFNNADLAASYREDCQEYDKRIEAANAEIKKAFLDTFNKMLAAAEIRNEALHVMEQYQALSDDSLALYPPVGVYCPVLANVRYRFFYDMTENQAFANFFCTILANPERTFDEGLKVLQSAQF